MELKDWKSRLPAKQKHYGEAKQNVTLYPKVMVVNPYSTRE